MLFYHSAMLLDARSYARAAENCIENREVVIGCSLLGYAPGIEDRFSHR